MDLSKARVIDSYPHTHTQCLLESLPSHAYPVSVGVLAHPTQASPSQRREGHAARTLNHPAGLALARRVSHLLLNMHYIASYLVYENCVGHFSIFMTDP